MDETSTKQRWQQRIGRWIFGVGALAIVGGTVVSAGSSWARRPFGPPPGHLRRGGLGRPAGAGFRLEEAFARTREMLAYAQGVVMQHRSVGAPEFRKALIYQRAARNTLRRGAPGLAIQLTREARRWAREAVIVNRVAFPPRFVMERPGELVPPPAAGAPPAAYAPPTPQELQGAFSQAEQGLPAEQQLLGSWSNFEGDTVQGGPAGAPPAGPVVVTPPPGARPPVAPSPTYVSPRPAPAAPSGGSW